MGSGVVAPGGHPQRGGVFAHRHQIVAFRAFRCAFSLSQRNNKTPNYDAPIPYIMRLGNR